MHFEEFETIREEKALINLDEFAYATPSKEYNDMTKVVMKNSTIFTIKMNYDDFKQKVMRKNLTN